VNLLKGSSSALILVCSVIAAGAGAAQDSAGSRNAAPQAHGPSGPDGNTRLPDWFGQWEIAGLTPSANGGFEQSIQDVMQEIKKWGPPPYNSQMRAVFEQAAAQTEKGSNAAVANGPGAEFLHRLCSFGFPAVMIDSPLMFEILPTQKETAMVFSGREIRHIYTDRRPHTAKYDLWPTYWGDSIGHWEGRTLVIDTIEVNSPFVPEGSIVIAFGGSTNEARLVAMLSPEAHFTERVRMIDKDHLEDRMTVIDPNFFTAPWRISRQYQRVTRIHRMVHEDCEGEDRNPVVNGHYTVVPPPSSSAPPKGAP
jgi:hypothetical protein